MGQQKQSDLREELRILTTQIETINQQLANSSGGGNDPALLTGIRAMEEKIGFLYESVKGMNTQLNESVHSYFEQIGTQVTKSLNTNLTQVFAKIDEMQRALAVIQESGVKSGGGDNTEVKKSLQDLISVYKDEVAVFKEQNEFLQKRLVAIERKLDAGLSFKKK
ncbi:hypothetical protein GOV10_06935 [Candidatus Woesearchaeota archaeon]|nr:hypothetical protein [Candidatus Woesearchaeota archaeon]